MSSYPSSCNIMIAALVTGMVIEAIQPIKSAFMAFCFSMSAMPLASRCSSASLFATTASFMVARGRIRTYILLRCVSHS